MELDLQQLVFDPVRYTPQEIEECFEDPFGIRLMPDDVAWTKEARYFCLAKTLKGRPLLIVYWSNGKTARVVGIREMSDAEQHYYNRKHADI